ncbi:MAG: ABC transporter ATP-binding protein [Herpetosiphon sp.]
MAAIIQATNLSKSYGKQRGIAGVTFSIQEGEVFGFLGPNGAGKTTTMRVLMGLLRPSGGTATIGERDCWRQSTDVKRLVGYLPGEFTFDAGLRGAQIIEYPDYLRGGVDQGYVRALVERLDFDPSRRFREYSRGNKQKLGLVQALMHRPPLLILDEPTGGLDPLNQQEFYKLVSEVHAEGRTILLSSHILPEIEHTCDRVAIIRDGSIVMIDHVASLKNVQQHDVEISFAGPASVAWFNGVPGVISAVQGADARTLHLTIQGPLTDVIQAASVHNASNIVTREPALEEVFLHFYEHARPAAHATSGR